MESWKQKDSIQQNCCDFFLHGSIPVIIFRVIHSFWNCKLFLYGCHYHLCRGFTLTCCYNTHYRPSWKCLWELARFFESWCWSPGSMHLTLVAPTVVNDICIGCQKLSGYISSAEVPAVGNVTYMCYQIIGNVILLAVAPAVGVVSFLIRNFIHVRWA